jgi:hypothetical protein
MGKNIFAFISIALVLGSSIGTTVYLNNVRSDHSFFLSPASRFSPLVRIEKSGGDYVITGDKDELARFAQNFRFDAEFVYLSTIIGDALSAGLSEDWVRGNAQKVTQKMKFDLFDMSRLYRRGDAFYLPYGGRESGFPFILRYCPPGQPAENATGAPCLLVGGAKIFLENPIKNADEVDESLSDLNIKTESRQPLVKRNIFSGKRRSIAYLNELEFGAIVKNEKNLKAIKDAVSKNYELKPNVRAVYVDLPEPVTIDGRRWSRTYIKGIVFDETKPIALNEGVNAMGYDYNPIFVDQNGSLSNPGLSPSPEGAMTYKKAKAEFKNHYLMFNNGYLAANNVLVAAPLGYGIFPDAPLYGGERLGYVILGVDDQMPDRVKAKPVTMSVLARTLRMIHNAGFTHPYLYFGNVSARGNSVYVHDLDSAEYISSARGRMYKMVMSEARDIFSIYMKNIYYRLSSLRFVSPAANVEVQAERAKLEAQGRASIKDFVSAYFYDCPKKLKDYLTEDGLIKPMEFMADKIIVSREKELPCAACDEAGKAFFMLLRHNFTHNRVSSPKAIAPSSGNGVSEGYIDADVEKGAAIRFIDALKIRARAAEAEKKMIIVGMDLSWVPEEQARIIQPALNAVKDLSRHGIFINIIIVRGKGNTLAEEVLKESSKAKLKPSRVIVLANGATAFGDVFTAFKDTDVEEKLLLVGVSPTNILKNNYIRIFDMLNMALSLAFNETRSARNPFIDVVLDPNNRRIIHFIPRSEPLSYEKLENVYYLQSLAAKST